MANNFDLSGHQLGNYRLISLLGEGGMGSVYRAIQVNLDREVAVKILPRGLASNPDFVTRFEREAKTVAQLDQHNHIISIIDYGTEDNISYVVMPLLSGGSLAQRMRSGEPYTLDDIANLLDALASALDFAHDVGIIHRDIKPDNIMFNQLDNPFIVDFGIAKIVRGDVTSLTGAGQAIGTPAFMAPEQWRGEQIVPATDQYALAIVIYILLTNGKFPFTAPTPESLMFKHLQEVPTRPDMHRMDLPDGVSDVLLKALSKNPNDRWMTNEAFANAFRDAIEGRNVAYASTPTQVDETTTGPYRTRVTPTPASGTFPQVQRRNNLLLFGLPTLIIIVLIAALVIVLSGSGGGNDNRDNENAGANVTATTSATLTDTPTVVTQVAIAALTETTTLTETVAPTNTTQPSATATNSLEPSATNSPQPTATFSDTPEIPPTLEPAETLIARANAQDTATAIMAATQTATSFTPTSTPDVRATIDAYRTETATQWTLTPSITFTPTYTATATFTLTPTFTSTLIDTPSPSHTNTLTMTYTSAPTSIAELSPLILAANGVESNDDWEPIIQDVNGYQMALVPVGEFEMGSTDSSADINEDPHQQTVTAPFYIDVYEVTNVQFAAFLSDPANANNRSAEGIEYLNDDDRDTRIEQGDGVWMSALGYEQYPVVEVTWFGARDFCNWRDARLPTELEWEYAASGPSNWQFPWGDEWNADNVVWDTNNPSDTNTAEVGTRPQGASWVGALDMSGNVLEWVSSLHLEYPYGSDHEDITNTIGVHVMRGGSSGYLNPGYSRTADRSGFGAQLSNNFGGFRCARGIGTTSPELTAEITDADNSDTADIDRSITTDPITLANESVESNDEWEPYIQVIDGVEMALVPVGCFEMGSSEDLVTQPVHRQCINEPFWIDVYKVSRSVYDLCVDTGECIEAAVDSISFEPSHPVNNITWYMAALFCESRDARLPSERQWEYAARGPDSLNYPWGNEFEASQIISISNDEARATVDAEPSGESWVGARQLTFNGREWTSSLYYEYPYDASDGRESGSGNQRVRRGNDGYSRTWSRGDMIWDSTAFRCVRTFNTSDLIEENVALTSTPTISNPSNDLPQLIIDVVTANIRTGPGTDYEIQQVIMQGESFSIVSTWSRGGFQWYEIMLDDDLTAWVADTVVTLADPVADIPESSTIPATPVYASITSEVIIIEDYCWNDNCVYVDDIGAIQEIDSTTYVLRMSNGLYIRVPISVVSLRQ